MYCTLQQQQQQSISPTQQVNAQQMNDVCNPASDNAAQSNAPSRRLAVKPPSSKTHTCVQ
jgi:hypothetical protein